MPSSSDQPRTRYQIIKENWGSRPKFQNSYGLKMSESLSRICVVNRPISRVFFFPAPDDIEEGNLILDEMVRHEREEWEERQRAAGRR